MKKFKHIDDFELTPKQEKAVEAVEKALQKAKESGLYILAKQENLAFYRIESYKHSLNNPLHAYWNQGEEIPCKYIDNAINDAGADDAEYFKKGVFDEEGNLIK